MLCWMVPPPKMPVKTRENLIWDVRKKVKWLTEKGLLRVRGIAVAMIKVESDLFVPETYRARKGHKS